MNAQLLTLLAGPEDQQRQAVALAETAGPWDWEVAALVHGVRYWLTVLDGRPLADTEGRRAAALMLRRKAREAQELLAKEE